jgi:MoaA/NifB/PqqE/SkfB family radical SAM enzyme
MFDLKGEHKMTVEFQTLVAQVANRNVPIPSLGKTLDSHELLMKRYEAAQRWAQAGLLPDEGWSAPLGLQLELTHKCNLECVHCYNNSSAHRTEDDLTTEEWLDVARQAAHHRVLNAVISGGEPLLRQDAMFGVMDILHEVGTRFLFITNGWLVDPPIVRRLRKYRFTWIQVSIDGSRPEIHDRVRQRQGSWLRAVRAAKMLVDAGLPVTIAHVVTPWSVDWVEEMCDLAAQLGVRQLFCDRSILVGRAAVNQPRVNLTPEQEEKLRQTLMMKQSQYRQHLVIRPAADPAVSLRFYMAEPSRVCLIRPNGNVKLDCLAPFSFGNVREEPLEVIWQRLKKGWSHPAVLQFVQSIKSNRDLTSPGDGRVVPHVSPDIELYRDSYKAVNCNE